MNHGVSEGAPSNPYSHVNVHTCDIHFQPRRFAVLRLFENVCVCGGGGNELEVCTTLEYIHISVHSVHKHTHTCILKPFEDSELTGLKVDIACKLACRAWKSWVSGTWCLRDHCPSVVMKTSCALYAFVFFSHFKHSMLSITVMVAVCTGHSSCGLFSFLCRNCGLFLFLCGNSYSSSSSS